MKYPEGSRGRMQIGVAKVWKEEAMGNKGL